MDTLVHKERAGSTLNVYVNALRFLFVEVLSQRMTSTLVYAKTPQTLPTVLSKEEVKRLLAAIQNPKQRLMLELLYSAGLRVSELTCLKKTDLDFEQCLGWVRRGKGGKDRIFILADKLNHALKRYLLLYPSESSYLFPGRYGRYSTRSLHEIVKRAAKKAGIQKNVHCHTLRHSFATHLVENGYDIASIQSLLGHSSSKTTMIYIHMASPKLVNVRSPFDDL